MAIVGTGFGVRTQLPGFRAAGGYEIVSLTGRDPSRTRRLAEANGVPHALETIEQAIGCGEPDLVCVTTPPSLHLPMAAAVLGAGRHCLLEKPMALDADEAERLVETASGAPAVSLIDHELRAIPNRQDARRRIAAGDIGRPLHVDVRFASHGRAAAGLTWGWLAGRAFGGGMLGAIGSHMIDMLAWWLGSVATVRARLRTSIGRLPGADGRLRDVETDDGADLLLTFASGATATVVITAIAGRYEGIDWTVHGEDGSLRVRNDGRLLVGARGAGMQDVSIDDGLGDTPLPDDSEWARGFVLLARDLRPALADGRPPDYAASFRDGLATQWVIDAARDSHATGGAEITLARAPD